MFQTKAVMEREARTLQEQDYAGNRKEQACPSNVRKTLDKQYYKGSTRNIVRSKQRRPQHDKLGGRGGSRPGWGRIAEALGLLSYALLASWNFPGFPVLPWAPLGSPGLSWALLGSTGLPWAPLGTLEHNC